MAGYPTQRLRRLRATPTLRRMVRETRVTPDDLIAPLFVQNGEEICTPIASLPGQNRFSPDTAAQEAEELLRETLGGLEAEDLDGEEMDFDGEEMDLDGESLEEVVVDTAGHPMGGDADDVDGAPMPGSDEESL